MLPGWPAPLGDDLARVFTEPLLNCPTAVQLMTEGHETPTSSPTAAPAGTGWMVHAVDVPAIPRLLRFRVIAIAAPAKAASTSSPRLLCGAA